MLNNKDILGIIYEGTHVEMSEILEEIRGAEDKSKFSDLVDPLHQIIQNSSDKKKRIIATYILGYIGDRRSVNLLIEILKDEKVDFGGRREVLELLECSPGGGKKKVKVSDNESDALRSAAAVSLGLLGEESARDILVDVLFKDRAWDVRAAAAFSLGEIGGMDTVSVLNCKLRDEKNIIVCDNLRIAIDRIKKENRKA